MKDVAYFKNKIDSVDRGILWRKRSTIKQKVTLRLLEQQIEESETLSQNDKLGLKRIITKRRRELLKLIRPTYFGVKK